MDQVKATSFQEVAFFFKKSMARSIKNYLLKQKCFIQTTVRIFVVCKQQFVFLFYEENKMELSTKRIGR